MLNAIIDLSLAHRKLVLLLTLGLVAAGALAIPRLSIDAFPDVTDVMVQVNTVAPALAPEEVERQITARVEQALGGLPALALLRSVSKFGLSQVTVVFREGTDLYFARAQVLERLQTVELPDGLERPTMGPIATGLGEIFHYIVTAPDGDLTSARLLQDWVVRPRLLTVPGVAEVNSWGGFEKEFSVVLDPLRLARHGLTLADLEAALARANLNVGGGAVEAAGEALLVHGVGLAADSGRLGAIWVAAHDGRAVYVRDVADVVEGRRPRRGAVTYGGRGEAVLGLGFMLMGENSHAVAGRLRRELAAVGGALPAGARLDVVYDRTELVDLVLHTVKKNLCEGALLVVAVLFLFLGHFRAACIVAAAIPLAMLFALDLMVRAGIAGTLMSLGAIDFGLVVDSSVILVENAVRRVHEDRSGRPLVEIVADAAKEVRKPTLFGELIILVVYLPVLALEGVEGKLFKPMALTVMFALAGSLVLSLTLMPVLTSLFLQRRAGTGTGAGAHDEPWIARALKRLYRPVVAWLVDRRVLVLGSALIAVAGAVPVALRLGATFVPRLDEGSVVVNTIRLPGVSLAESNRMGTVIEQRLLAEFPDEVRAVWTRTGTPEVATDPMGLEVSDVFIMLHPRERWQRARTQEELRRALDATLRPLPGMNYSFTQPIEMRFNEMIAGVRTDLGVKLFGDDFAVLKESAEKVRALLATIPGAANPFVEPLVGEPVLHVELKGEELARHGLAAREVLDLVEATGGKEVGEVRVGDRRFPLALRLPEFYVNNPSLFGTLPVTAADGARLPLARVAEVTRASGPLVINREWGKRRALVTVNVEGRDLGGFVGEVQRRVDAELGAGLRAAGVQVRYSGQFENLERATARLALIVPLALGLVLVLVYSTYGNIPDSLRVFTGVPFAMVGGVLALWWRGMPFSVPAGIGFIALSGVSVLADMVMVSTIRGLLEQGRAVREAVLAAAEQRLRPVLMTALVAGLGFLPMAASTGVGAEVQRPLATVVIGGLMTSTLLTLFVLPTLYVALRGGGGGGQRPDGERTRA
ncbi:MAG: efflux RND transporter permease subunit [Planctomycetes bacterium]|nr:efflux RND transporter permease subunit [Planctomycetota bacterium]